jgi:hypothetical protein
MTPEQDGAPDGAPVPEVPEVHPLPEVEQAASPGFISPACEITAEQEAALLGPWQRVLAELGLPATVKVARIMERRVERHSRVETQEQLLGVRIWRDWLPKRPHVATWEERVVVVPDGKGCWRLWGTSDWLPLGTLAVVLRDRPPVWHRLEAISARESEAAFAEWQQRAKARASEEKRKADEKAQKAADKAERERESEQRRLERAGREMSRARKAVAPSTTTKTKGGRR